MTNWEIINLDQNNYNPVSITDIISNKRNTLHNILFESAKELALINYVDDSGNHVFLNNYNENTDFEINDIILFVDEQYNKTVQNNAKYYINISDWKIIEVNNIGDNYLSAPSIICTLRNHLSSNGIVSIVKYYIDLSPWWKIEYLSEEIKRNNGITTEILDQYPFNEIIYYDYINETALLENRVETNKRKIGFKDISNNDVLNITNKSVINHGRF